jgi:hypothetical protein
MIFVLASAALAAASPPGQYTAPVAKDFDTWIAPYFDWPERGVDRGTFTTVSMDLTVNTHGGLDGCKVTNLVGNPGMGDYTCTLLRGRAHFEPARDPAGRKIEGVFRTRVTWAMPKNDLVDQRFDVPLHTTYRVAVDRLPPATKEPAVATVQFAVDTKGQASACTPDDEKVPALAQLACDALGPVFKSEPARDRKGKLVESAQTATVQLVPR